ncbi:hypothetical protein CRG98_015282 [Punica granatum]|uniref:Uncharacterized protein n=1 Tax=Punica granatum TaxID=22663 RepID=A0A2I0K6Z9_PUNGR|nr:hypothetical protein CRG98_015282 [Punica granatum]
MRAGASRRQEHAGVRQSGGRLLGVRSVRWSASVCVSERCLSARSAGVRVGKQRLDARLSAWTRN